MNFLRFRTFSISNKLMGIVVFSWLLIAGLITSFFVGQDFYFFRSSRVADLTGLAEVIGINCTAPLEFADSDTATEVLSSLSARPQIEQAVVYTKNNKLFAQYVSMDKKAGEQDFPELFQYNTQELGEDAFFFNDNHLDLYVPVRMDSKVIGTLLLRENLNDFKEKLIRTAYVVGGIMAASLFFAWIVFTLLQRYISHPILTMADAMRRVRDGKQYSTRIRHEFTDEFGVLADGFNSMLDHIQQRDKQLLDAKRLAEEASRAKSKFLAQMSHEIRTPMNGVIGIASLLGTTTLDGRQAQYVRTISRSGEALLLIINDILDFSKIESGKLELEEIPFCPREVAEEVVNLFSEQASRKGLCMNCYLDPDIPLFLTGDPGRLRQVLMNLLGNGVKFTSRGRVDLAIHLEEKGEDGVCLLFKVTDSGIGIRQDKLHKIFSAFSQADDSTTRKFGGTGLGLVICEQLVKLQGGEIGVESEKGKGSTFWFTIHYGIAQDKTTLFLPDMPDCHGESLKTSLAENNAQFRDAHILVVEDNQTNQIVTTGMLEQLGCRVSLAENGVEAVMAVQHTAYDLVFMDCHMPQMDGYEASEKIRRNADQNGEKHIPIIALTAHAMKGDLEQCLAAGMDDYLSKPCSEHQIKRILKKWLPSESMTKPADKVVLRQPLDSPDKTVHPHPTIPGIRHIIDKEKGKSNMHVLVVEDDEINQDVAVGMLERFGCRVHLVYNGREAVETVTAKTYDLIFMDCQMPVMDGFEATTAIRSLEKTKGSKYQTPIIAMTGNSFAEDREKCLLAGMDDYISKPFVLKEFRKTVEHWSSAKSARDGFHNQDGTAEQSSTCGTYE